MPKIRVHWPSRLNYTSEVTVHAVLKARARVPVCCLNSYRLLPGEQKNTLSSAITCHRIDSGLFLLRKLLTWHMAPGWAQRRYGNARCFQVLNAALVELLNSSFENKRQYIWFYSLFGSNSSSAVLVNGAVSSYFNRLFWKGHASLEPIFTGETSEFVKH